MTLDPCKSTLTLCIPIWPSVPQTWSRCQEDPQSQPVSNDWAQEAYNMVTQVAGNNTATAGFTRSYFDGNDELLDETETLESDNGPHWSVTLKLDLSH